MDVKLDAGVRLGDFKILKLLGAGGDGTVYQAKQVSVNRQVALKVIGQSLRHPSDIARFRRQAHALAKLRHPNIAEVYYVGQDDNFCYMAMRHVDGISLRQFLVRVSALKETPPSFTSLLADDALQAPGAKPQRFDVEDCDGLDESGVDADPDYQPITGVAEQFIGSRDYTRRCCTVMRDAARALHYAHEEGVIHRDIKPENIMLDREGGVHLIDFGLARFIDDVSLSSTGALVGTPMYMSPEQITGRVNIDRRSDLYSLGIVMYEILTARLPFASSTREAMFKQIITKRLPPVRWRNRAVSRELEAVVHKAIAKDPDERYQTAGELGEDLEAVLNGRPVSARPYRYRFDDSEINAARPAVIMICAFNAWFVSMIAFIFAVLMLSAHIVGTSRRIDNEGLNFAIIFGIAATMAWAGLGILRGGKTGITIATLVNLIILGSGMYSASNYGRGPETTVDSVMLTMSLIITLYVLVLPIVIYSLRRSREWVRYAAIVRAEYREQLRRSP